jgi:aminopeptidase N
LNFVLKLWPKRIHKIDPRSRKSVANQTALAAEVGPRVLEFFERHYNIKFPLPKMDMIAIPDFGAGAMENWGLITYRETGT